MLIAVGAIALAAFVGLVLLIRYIGKGGVPGTALWAALLVVVTIIASLTAQITSIYYKTPFGWALVVVAAVLVAAALFWLVGRSVSWKGSRVLALIGVVVLSLVTFTFVMIAAPTGSFFTPLFEARAQQIADANGFGVLLPSDRALNTDAGMPVDDTDNGLGVTVGYKGFNLAERKAEGTLSYSDLEKLVATGERPIGDIGPGSEIPDDAEYRELEVDGRPALGVSYRAVTEEKMDDLLGTDPVNILVFERDGVAVVLFSQGYMEYQGDETYTPRPPLAFEELVEIAESLRPVG